jgi:hypothetical protein
MLICDTFTLIGIRGYDKQQVKNKENSVQEPVFKMTMATEDLEALGGCMTFEQQDSGKAMAKIMKNLVKNPENGNK